mmetsp:Transcript_6603/g.21381  ORF Transcript_6603/g.21381 Transcript_6603/m.21381 type:complete len:203 (-) Transcript_6603:545-1153(-)
MRTLPSAPPVTKVPGLPGRKATTLTVPVWPVTSRTRSPLRAFHTHATPTPDPVAINLSSLDHATPIKAWSIPCCTPLHCFTNRSPAQYGCTSHTATVPSIAVEASLVPSHETARLVTVSVWCGKVKTGLPSSRPWWYTRMTGSMPATANRPSVRAATAVSGKAWRCFAMTSPVLTSHTASRPPSQTLPATRPFGATASAFTT